jgi:hypothetical protein
MRASRAFVLCYAASAAVAGCVPLPALDFNVRSTWRERPEQRGRSLEVITGVLLGWSDETRVRAPLDAEDDLLVEHAHGAGPFAFADEGLPCADLELCRWERDERSAALERAGALADEELP